MTTREEIVQKLETMTSEEWQQTWERLSPEQRYRLESMILQWDTREGISDSYVSRCEALFDAARAQEPTALPGVDLYEAETEHGHVRVAVDRESFVSVAQLEVRDEAGLYRDVEHLPDEATLERQAKAGHDRCRRALDGKKPKRKLEGRLDVLSRP